MTFARRSTRTGIVGSDVAVLDVVPVADDGVQMAVRSIGSATEQLQRVVVRRQKHQRPVRVVPAAHAHCARARVNLLSSSQHNTHKDHQCEPHLPEMFIDARNGDDLLAFWPAIGRERGGRAHAASQHKACPSTKPNQTVCQIRFYEMMKQWRKSGTAYGCGRSRPCGARGQSRAAAWPPSTRRCGRSLVCLAP